MINEKQLILKQNPENTLSQTLKNSFTTWILLLDIRNLLKTVTLLNICRNRHAIIAYVKIRTVAFI